MPEAEAHRANVTVVTGATSGIGRALMDQLAERGGWLIGVGRSLERNQTAKAEIGAAYPHAHVSYLRADLASLRQVRALAASVREQMSEWGLDGLDGLVNNAAMVTFWREETEDGYEKQWAVNHLAPFLLTNELLPLLIRADKARVVTVSSGSHRGARIDWDNLQMNGLYNALRAYSQSKFANVLFSYELDRRTPSDLRAFAADPGLVDTDLAAKGTPFFVRWAWMVRRRGGISPEQAAKGVLKLLVDPELQQAEQVYWRRGRPVAPDPNALDPDAAERLWRVSAEMCGIDKSD
ncbi:MAG: SDR family NAD(P)-dependent oxidoreductase [Anaerolineales bacterium]|nr:SDR family NAD(P)-dependent oxidoreductase [Anaerolineales bacterium]